MRIIGMARIAAQDSVHSAVGHIFLHADSIWFQWKTEKMARIPANVYGTLDCTWQPQAVTGASSFMPYWFDFDEPALRTKVHDQTQG